MIKRNILLATSLVGAFIGLGSQMARAQDAAPAASGGTQVGEVVVTAQRRTERLVDVPVTVAVVSGAQLAQRGVTDVLGLQRMTAGLQMPFNGAFLAPSIRGISANATMAAAPANIAFYVDGVYQPSQAGSFLDLPDVQDIEILKGPQGTLYGQNAEGGAIVINTMEPKFKWQGKLSASYGNYNDIRVVGYETGPITDSISQSVAGVYEHHDGFRTSVVNGKRDQGLEEELLRLKLLFKPNDKAAITIAGFYSWHQDDSIFTGIAYKGQSIGTDIDPALAHENPHQYSTSGSLPNAVREYGGSIKGVFDVGLGNLTWLSSYDNVISSSDFDADWSPYWYSRSNPATYSRAVIEEGDFVSRPIGPVSFSTGLFYEHFEESIAPSPFDIFNNGTSFFGFGPVFPGCCSEWPGPRPGVLYDGYTELHGDRDVLAGYLEGSWNVTSAFTVTAGGRYSTDTMHGYFDGSCNPVSTTNAACNVGVRPGSGNYVLTELLHSPASWNNFTPRVTARYKLTPSSNVYFNYSEGYRSGVLNSNGLANLPAKPETLDAYEVGYKGSLFDRLNLGVAGFYYQYKNKLEAIYLAPTYSIQNAASATTNGVDFDATFVATPELSITASVEWLEATFGKYPGAEVYVLPGSCPAPTCVVAAPASSAHGADTVLMNLSHRQMERAPKWSGDVSANYHTDTQWGRFTANGSLYYTSKVLWDENGYMVQNPYVTVDMELGFVPASQPQLRFVLWGKNLTDAAYFQSVQETGEGFGGSYSPPRQFGGRVEYKF